MKKLMLAASLMLAVASPWGKADNDDNRQKKTFTVENFDSITLDGAYEIDYEMTEGDPYVVIIAPPKVLGRLEPQVKNGEMKIKRVDSEKKVIGVNVNLNTNVTVKAFSKTLKSVSLSGTGDFECENGFETETFVAKVSGAGSIDIKRLCADDVKVTVSGIGDVDLENMDCGKVDVTISGAGDAELSGNVTDVVVKISGTGNADFTELTYESLESKISGIGKIKKSEVN
ncbi:MAG: DUF2807 domain-containing protein [Bacteroidales bacterium]|nr:DUF2807 domain-containing protein [Bacteroidales bacterium]